MSKARSLSINNKSSSSIPHVVNNDFIFLGCWNNINCSKNEKTLNRNVVLELLKNLYSTNFFKEINIEIKNNTLFLELTEYPVINQLVINGEKSNKFKNEIKKIINLKENDSFIESFLSEDLNLIKNLYSAQGYNFTKINPKITGYNGGC